MAIDVSGKPPLRHISTYTSSGNFTVPGNTNLIYVTIHGAGSGGQAAHGNSYGGSGTAGAAAIAAIQVSGGTTCAITIGAGGAGGAGGGQGSTGNAGGTTDFDGRLQVTGAPGGSASGRTTLPSPNPGANTIVSTGTITSQNTGGGAGGGGAPTWGAAGQAGSNGSVFIYA